jgi:fatty-acyl-CoA synthase
MAGETFSARPLGRILLRHPDVLFVAVYAVPDVRVGDQVMAALQLRPGARFDAGSFDSFLTEQADLGTKWTPRFVRVVESLPLGHTHKILKRELRAQGWDVADPVWWKPEKGAAYRPFTRADAAALRAGLERHARAHLLGAS